MRCALPGPVRAARTHAQTTASVVPSRPCRSRDRSVGAVRHQLRLAPSISSLCLCPDFLVAHLMHRCCQQCLAHSRLSRWKVSGNSMPWPKGWPEAAESNGSRSNGQRWYSQGNHPRPACKDIPETHMTATLSTGLRLARDYSMQSAQSVREPRSRVHVARGLRAELAELAELAGDHPARLSR